MNSQFTPERGEELVRDIFNLFIAANPPIEETLGILASLVNGIVDGFPSAEQRTCMDRFVEILFDMRTHKYDQPKQPN